MRTKLLLIVFIISTFAFSINSNDSITQNKIENLQKKIDTLKLDNKNLKKENENVKKDFEIIKAKSESTSVMIDNVDSMYQNNFDRMIFLFGSLGAIIVFASPIAVFFYNRWLKDQQEKIIDLKEKDLNASNEGRIKELLMNFNEKLSESEEKHINKLIEEKEKLEEKLNASNEEQIKEVIKHLEERFTESEYNFYNKLDEHKKNLEEDINEKTQELEKNITETEYSLIAKISLFISVYSKDNENYNEYVNFTLLSLKSFYNSNKYNLPKVIEKFKELMIEIEDMGITISQTGFKIFNFLKTEIIKSDLKISKEDLSLFDTFEKTVKVEEDKKSEE
ncbi:hypothetical protein [Empedobacter brevis]|uniref:hypothetical protein n=1 Tax=Empedobacter brevis TaxID=247 RepID=UPI0033428E55